MMSQPTSRPAHGRYFGRMRLHVADHPLIAHKLTVLRDNKAQEITATLAAAPDN